MCEKFSVINFYCYLWKLWDILLLLHLSVWWITTIGFNEVMITGCLKVTLTYYISCMFDHSDNTSGTSTTLPVFHFLESSFQYRTMEAFVYTSLETLKEIYTCIVFQCKSFLVMISAVIINSFFVENKFCHWRSVLCKSCSFSEGPEIKDLVHHIQVC